MSRQYCAGGGGDRRSGGRFRLGLWRWPGLWIPGRGRSWADASEGVRRTVGYLTDCRLLDRLCTARAPAARPSRVPPWRPAHTAVHARRHGQGRLQQGQLRQSYCDRASATGAGAARAADARAAAGGAAGRGTGHLRDPLTSSAGAVRACAGRTPTGGGPTATAAAGIRSRADRRRRASRHRSSRSPRVRAASRWCPGR